MQELSLHLYVAHGLQLDDIISYHKGSATSAWIKLLATARLNSNRKYWLSHNLLSCTDKTPIMRISVEVAALLQKQHLPCHW